MSDTLLTISVVALDTYMRQRITASAAQNHAPGHPETWAVENCYLWASAPGWAAAWDSALAGGIQEPGKEPAVITDGMINSQIQTMLAVEVGND